MAAAAAYQEEKARGDRVFVGNLPWDFSDEVRAPAPRVRTAPLRSARAGFREWSPPRTHSARPLRARAQELLALAKKAGEVLTANVQQRPDGRSKGFGIVTFVSADTARKAIGELNGQDVKGRRIQVHEDRPAPARNAGEGPRVNRRVQQMAAANHKMGLFVRSKAAAECQVFVGNLPYTTSWQDLKDLCKEFGQVSRADILTDRATGRSKGSGIVVFASSEEARRCVEGLNGKTYYERQLHVKIDEYAKPPPPSDGRLYVGNLPWQTTWKELKELFKAYGEVLRADVATDFKTGRSKGFGTVAFAKEEEAEAAISALHDSDFHGRKLMVRKDNQADGARD
jgi:RNA recognition motif-containing protein